MRHLPINIDRCDKDDVPLFIGDKGLYGIVFPSYGKRQARHCRVHSRLRGRLRDGLSGRIADIDVIVINPKNTLII
jgi:hypothetical protein